MKDTNQKLILDYLEANHYAQITDISQKLYISPSTVRRTLNELQAKGLVTRKHGGVQINNENNYFPSFTFRTHQNSIEKKKMALLAVNLIHDGDVIFLDGSTSTFFIAEYLKTFKNIVVITNGIDTLSVLSKCGITAFSTGGMISPTNNSVLIGHNALESIKCFHANVSFLSAQSADAKGVIYDCFNEENSVRQVMMENSTKKVLLLDDSKVNKTSPYRLCSINNFDTVISNSDIRDKFDVEIPHLIYK